MFLLSVLILIFGIALVMIGSTKIAKKDYDINVKLQPDVEKIIKETFDNYLSKNIDIEKKCQHNWKTIKSGKINRKNGGTGFYYDLQCKHCGEITTRET